MELKDILKDGSKELNVEITGYQVDQLIKYKDILLEWNQKMNLTAIEEEKEVMIKHFLDSLSCIQTKYLKTEGRMIDVGTGAGFPGVPLKIALPNIELTLLDSLKKRIGFLEEVCRETNLINVEFLHGRAEDFGQNKAHREKYDYAVSRAVAALNILVEYCLPFVKVGGYFICQKGPGLIEELPEAKNAIKILGGEVVDQIVIDLPFSDITHHILVIKKIKQTPIKYPRKAGKPSKEPIK
ncbi:16S rRNA (guanine(527)-N(7))-methyltransferase RsmG [Alkaliphilus sp. MSJ-5]|uniref:Ribosomal RNA small subunit methyltransferase G n=1 Tax=Alkaliphilus flagellatus TaxID=2841507 RepID=A0ABS6G298_9FIRM|nr:16S rRNA (guanine(527)-N(7))-methyltransferase RsmG [Alkaliphilus flagellatus]MBU5676301.1 16S rRNA (guanine(527)-N(7))-methyltransferase RsmG [Alkaliphilus flagellatus]